MARGKRRIPHRAVAQKILDLGVVRKAGGNSAVGTVCEGHTHLAVDSILGAMQRPMQGERNTPFKVKYTLVFG
ncbi:hypothetical protein YTPLAS72_02180 [Nitrospira sp.]|nr:hypothetical protein YTPLAS72_02180 [Nitrospira sp.]